ncbi:MAG: cardiolipin synthase [Lachnospiraceae bacterium]|nr:cardiolipin synthase [Lachnospiraceae bacterium]
MIIILMLLMQILLLFWLFARMGVYSKFGLAVLQMLSVLIIIYIVNSKENPGFKLAWIIPIAAFPVFGTLLFLFVQTNPGNLQLRRKLQRRVQETMDYSHTTKDVLAAVREDGGDIDDMCHYIEHINYFPTFANTEVTYFGLGEEKFKDLLCELENARHFIFLEYFIIARGYMWGNVLKILKKKAREGVEVRVMYDGTCTLVNLPYDYAGKLAEFGIKAKTFSPIKPLLSTHQNNRDHRKILVIDGRVAYTGGINLADEYINEIEMHGHWKDAAIKLTGDAVKSFTVMFLQMWNVSETGKENYARYLRNANSGPARKEAGFVIPYNDDPFNKEDIAQRVYLDILNKAKSYVHIMTPYLIPDNEMIVGLCFAAQRGIDVKLMLPHIPDKRPIFYIARTYYRQLMEAGVKIYEYTPGFVHSKVFVSDDCKAVVGSINIDFRSLYQHFECAAYLYKNPQIRDIETDFQKTLRQCRLITPEIYKTFPLITRGIGHVLRVFGPLL